MRGLYYDKVPQRSKSMLTFACVVEISLSLYKLTPCSLKAFPVDLPILNTSSPSWKTVTKQVGEKEITLIQVDKAFYLGGLKSELLANVRTTNAFKSDAEGLLC